MLVTCGTCAFLEHSPAHFALCPTMLPDSQAYRMEKSGRGELEGLCQVVAMGLIK